MAQKKTKLAIRPFSWHVGCLVSCAKKAHCKAIAWPKNPCRCSSACSHSKTQNPAWGSTWIAYGTICQYCLECSWHIDRLQGQIKGQQGIREAAAPARKKHKAKSLPCALNKKKIELSFLPSSPVVPCSAAGPTCEIVVYLFDPASLE